MYINRSIHDSFIFKSLYMMFFFIIYYNIVQCLLFFRSFAFRNCRVAWRHFNSIHLTREEEKSFHARTKRVFDWKNAILPYDSLRRTFQINFMVIRFSGRFVDVLCSLFRNIIEAVSVFLCTIMLCKYVCCIYFRMKIYYIICIMHTYFEGERAVSYFNFRRMVSWG